MPAITRFRQVVQSSISQPPRVDMDEFQALATARLYEDILLLSSLPKNYQMPPDEDYSYASGTNLVVDFLFSFIEQKEHSKEKTGILYEACQKLLLSDDVLTLLSTKYADADTPQAFLSWVAWLRDVKGEKAFRLAANRIVGALINSVEISFMRFRAQQSQQAQEKRLVNLFSRKAPPSTPISRPKPRKSSKPLPRTRNPVFSPSRRNAVLMKNDFKVSAPSPRYKIKSRPQPRYTEILGLDADGINRTPSNASQSPSDVGASAAASPLTPQVARKVKPYTPSRRYGVLVKSSTASPSPHFEFPSTPKPRRSGRLSGPDESVVQSPKVSGALESSPNVNTLTASSPRTPRRSPRLAASTARKVKKARSPSRRHGIYLKNFTYALGSPSPRHKSKTTPKPRRSARLSGLDTNVVQSPSASSSGAPESSSATDLTAVSPSAPAPGSEITDSETSKSTYTKMYHRFR
ncbi:hypothetical protein VKT23_007966 [Stygiomarasmius scandens]|uniref:Uncharacterized protein n=1 Tax=Marasmiellus scandens TaxID=2682957 RepID=A0ABR1JNL3_9AGAR